MRVRGKRKGATGPAWLSLLGAILSMPGYFVAGLILGLTAPLAALAGLVGGVYLFTHKVPFFRQGLADEATGERSLVLQLMSPEEARQAFEARRVELGAAWADLRADLETLAREADETVPPAA
ncbi:MAG: hypothetical protein ACOYZ7_04795 [Chloroflexota bacterium]